MSATYTDSQGIEYLLSLDDLLARVTNIVDVPTNDFPLSQLTIPIFINYNSNNYEVSEIGENSLLNTTNDVVVTFENITIPSFFGGPWGQGEPELKALATAIYQKGTATGNLAYLSNYFGTLLKDTCFLEGTKILTKEGYKKIEELKKGDLVKTLLNGYKKIDMIGYKKMWNPASEERIKDQLYVYKKNKIAEVFEDLVLTGCHSVLIDNFESEEQKENVIKINGNTYVTEDTYRLPACLDERAEVYKSEGLHMIYHIALENEDYYNNYGVYANGLIVESCSKRYLKELSGMMLKE